MLCQNIAGDCILCWQILYLSCISCSLDASTLSSWNLLKLTCTSRGQLLSFERFRLFGLIPNLVLL